MLPLVQHWRSLNLPAVRVEVAPEDQAAQEVPVADDRCRSLKLWMPIMMVRFLPKN